MVAGELFSQFALDATFWTLKVLHEAVGAFVINFALINPSFFSSTITQRPPPGGGRRQDLKFLGTIGDNERVFKGVILRDDFFMSINSER